ncbi:hypothetical protein FA09DRAFT_154149 [Tilletiopsis washingtonensis]|uniref:Uncharacterized protein n=1 Tax=Tilletiopsis washingtonensis TaxID=58919 RepID=A0A316Z0E5_9BASI|nr:hypothetical protein FA09DRAFT_154149 [Tilletiopsis washingtonensis]PWN95207.1 hypothetical protein FA09DRAFT_154149 [Tilletiopsis washingtonensis]
MQLRPVHWGAASGSAGVTLRLPLDSSGPRGHILAALPASTAVGLAAVSMVLQPHKPVMLRSGLRLFVLSTANERTRRMGAEFRPHQEPPGRVSMGLRCPPLVRLYIEATSALRASSAQLSHRHATDSGLRGVPERH